MVFDCSHRSRWGRNNRLEFDSKLSTLDPISSSEVALYPEAKDYPGFSPYMAFDAEPMFCGYAYSGSSSPAMYPEDGDAKPSPSNLSSASAPSSAMRSPLSRHGQLPAIPEWQPQGLGVSPSIVSHTTYFSATEYSFASGVDLATSLDFSTAKPSGFVGELLPDLLLNLSFYKGYHPPVSTPCFRLEPRFRVQVTNRSKILP